MIVGRLWRSRSGRRGEATTRQERGRRRVAAARACPPSARSTRPLLTRRAHEPKRSKVMIVVKCTGRPAAHPSACPPRLPSSSTSDWDALWRCLRRPTPSELGHDLAVNDLRDGHLERVDPGRHGRHCRGRLRTGGVSPGRGGYGCLASQTATREKNALRSLNKRAGDSRSERSVTACRTTEQPSESEDAQDLGRALVELVLELRQHRVDLRPTNDEEVSAPGTTRAPAARAGRRGQARRTKVMSSAGELTAWPAPSSGIRPLKAAAVVVDPPDEFFSPPALSEPGLSPASEFLRESPSGLGTTVSGAEDEVEGTPASVDNGGGLVISRRAAGRQKAVE